MNYSDLLTQAIHTVRSTHWVSIGIGDRLTIDGFSMYANASGSVKIPEGIIKPTKYKIEWNRFDGGYNVYLLHQPMELIAYYTNGPVDLSDRTLEHCVYISGFGKPNLRMFVHFGPEEGYRCIPEPDEEGNYFIPPPGSSTKSCRK